MWKAAISREILKIGADEGVDVQCRGGRLKFGDTFLDVTRVPVAGMPISMTANATRRNCPARLLFFGGIASENARNFASAYTATIPAPDRGVADQRSGVQYYPVRVAFADGERDRLGALKLVPGMPVEGFIQTGYRTVFSYLTKPIADNMAKAFREE